MKFPTGGNPNGAPNLGPILIGDSKAPRTPTNRNTITADDVRTRAAFDRQINAGKALANLLSIVKQATANKNAAEEETTKRQDLYTAAVSGQRKAQDAVVKAESDLNRIKQAITMLTDNANAIRKKIGDLDTQSKDWQSQRDSTNQGINTANGQLNDVTSQINNAAKELANANDAKAAKQAECQSYDGEISKAKADASTKTNLAAVLAARLNNANDEVRADAQRVKDLEDQLAAARAKLANSQRTANDVAEQQASNNNLIASLNNRVADLDARKQKCGSNIAGIDEQIQRLKDAIAPLTDKQNKANVELRNLNDKLSSIGEQASKGPAQLSELTGQLTQINKNLVYLRSQQPIFERVLNDAYVAGNSANDQVSTAKQNLDAAAQRFQSEQGIEKSSTMNIERARIEKDAADKEVEKLLKEGANVLPFNAAPSADDQWSGDSGAPIPIGNWPDFVTATYGGGVKPLFVGDLYTLFGFTVYDAARGRQNGIGNGAPGSGSGNTAPGSGSGSGAPNSGNGNAPSGNSPGNSPGAAGGVVVPISGVPTTGSPGTTASGSGSGNCGADPSTLRALSGYVAGVPANNSFRVITDSGAYVINYSACTKALASQPDYSLKVGDVVVVKGVPKGASALDATHLTCVSL